MRKPSLVRWFYYLNLIVVTLLVTYKIYLNFFEQDFVAEHAIQVERIEAAISDRNRYRFAVLGNINNSVGIFERKIIPALNSQNYDFVISAGNAVSSGGEDKYRAVYRTLSRLSMPYLLAFGPMEQSRLGGFRFYDHFGPLHFSFAAGNNRLVFLDSTGTTDFGWQLRWLEEELAASKEQNQFVFSAHPLYPVAHTGLLPPVRESYLFPGEARGQLRELIEQYNVDAVFSANLPVFNHQRHGNTNYVVTGGAGGLLINNERSYYHFVSVSVVGDEIFIEEKQLDIGQHPIWRTIESFWFFVHSLFYVGYLNFILLVSGLIVLGTWLHSRIFQDRDYYPDFDIDPDALSGRRLKVAMFSNNYLPFIGGVPISIERLRQGLLRAGHQVLVVAPKYRRGDTVNENGVLRLRSLLPMGKDNEFRLANIFSWKLWQSVRSFCPDVIHVHHPFWLGWAGQVLGGFLRIPVIYTYHTRLEHYAHYVPLPSPLFRNLISHSLIKRFANHCDAIIVPTTSAEDYLRIIGVKKPIFVQPTGIEYERFAHVNPSDVLAVRSTLGIGDGVPVLISVSRLSQEKNILFMLDGLKLLADRGVDFHFLLIGEGHYRKQIQAHIQALSLDGKVTLVGAIPPDQIATYCHIADLFVFASRSETQGMVVLEAMASGLPVVVVRSSGIDDIVQQEYTGFKTAPNTNSWAQQVEALIESPELRRKLGSHASDFAQRHSIEQFTTSITRVYYYALATKTKSRV